MVSDHVMKNPFVTIIITKSNDVENKVNNYEEEIDVGNKVRNHEK